MLLEVINEDKTLIEFKKLLTNLEQKKIKEIISSLHGREEPEKSLRSILKKTEKLEKEDLEGKIEGFKLALLKSLFKKRTNKAKYCLANLMYLYSIKFKKNHEIAKNYIFLAKRIFQVLKNKKMIGKCWLNSEKIVFSQNLYENDFFEALRVLDNILLTLNSIPYEDIYDSIIQFLVRGYSEIFEEFNQKRVYGIAMKCLQKASLALSDLRIKNTEFHQKSQEHIASKTDEIKNNSPKMTFVFDTSFFCCFFDIYPRRDLENTSHSLNPFRIITKSLNGFAKVDYVVPLSFFKDLPKRYSSRIRPLNNFFTFKDYGIEDNRIEELKILNLSSVKLYFDEKENIDYKIIQNAIDHKHEENIVVIVTNDEGIHKFVKRVIPSENIQTIWCHTFIMFLARNEKKKSKRKLEDVSKKIQSHIENYRRRQKRKEIKYEEFEKAILSIKLGKKTLIH